MSAELRNSLEEQARALRPTNSPEAIAKIFSREGYAVAVTIHDEHRASMALTKDGQTYEIDCSYHPCPLPTALEAGGDALEAALVRRQEE